MARTAAGPSGSIFDDGPIGPLARDGVNWAPEETRLAMLLYLILPASGINKNSPDVIQLADALGRRPGSVAKKIANIQDHDPYRLALGKRGLSNGSRLDSQVWDWFNRDRAAFIEAETKNLRRALGGRRASPAVDYVMVDLPEGRERQVIAAARVNQQYFRNSLLANYEGSCCVTGIRTPELLVASHIKPWSEADPATERTNPANGLLLNALHDRAFDKGLMTIDARTLRIVLSPRLKRSPKAARWFAPFEGERIRAPRHMPPDPRFIEYHNDIVFQR